MLIYPKIFVNALQKLVFIMILIVASLAMVLSAFTISSIIAQSDTSETNITDTSETNITENGQISRRGL